MNSPEVYPSPGSQLVTNLADQRCRYVLNALRRSDGEATVDELARAVVARENETSEGVTDRHIKCIVAELHHLHLPTLAERGVVEYDHQAGIVRFGETAEKRRITQIQDLGEASKQ